MKKSFPKNKINILLLENIHNSAAKLLAADGFNVSSVASSLSKKELLSKIENVHILGIRSKTEVDQDILKAAKKLLAIGTFCIGTNQIDKSFAAQKGVVVFNAPYSNTRSVVELALGEMILLIRNIIAKNKLLHEGIWDKTTTNSYEIRGKVLGIVGYGNIGSQLSVLAEAMGMQVVFYDLGDKLALGNAKRMNTLADVLKKADVVSLHIDGREENTCLIGKKELDMMKPGSIFLNLSRGHVVDYKALKKALLNKRIAGAAVDVYPDEPIANQDGFVSELQGLPNVILTPHIGGSTQEAQEHIGDFVAKKLIQFINKGDTYGAVNFPKVQLPAFQDSHRMLHIHYNKPGILASINTLFAKYKANIQSQSLNTYGDVGYVITDINTNYDKQLIADLSAVKHTIKLRILY
ncbi:MAG: phosphoglycerate dehydrogenase [Chitinophagaceae bacterium]